MSDLIKLPEEIEQYTCDCCNYINDIHDNIPTCDCGNQFCKWCTENENYEIIDGECNSCRDIEYEYNHP